MRVLFDANVFIRYVLNRHQQSAVLTIVNAALAGEVELLVPLELIDELTRNITQGKLARKVNKAQFDRLMTLLMEIGKQPLRLVPPVPAYTRDAKDDYLIAHALAQQIDYVVSADNDLLVLAQVGSVQIVSPGAFSALLRQPDDRN